MSKITKVGAKSDFSRTFFVVIWLLISTCFVILSPVAANTPPGIEIMEPSHGETVNGTVVIWMVAWDADNLSEIQDVWVRFDGGPSYNATYNHTDAEGQWWYYEWDTTLMEEGWHDITAIVFDGTDDASHTIEVIVDNNHAPTIDIMEPAHGATVSGTVMIWMVAWDADNLSEIQDVWVQFDGGILNNATYNHTDAEGQWWYFEWDTTLEEEGWHDVRAEVYDGIEEGHDVIEVQVDNNHAPTIDIMEPAHGATVSGTVMIWMVAWDADNLSEIQDVWARFDGGPWHNATYNHTNAEGQWWYFEWDTTEVEDGWHSIGAIVYDGMEYGDDLIEVIVDNEPENHAPTIEIVEPDHGATVSGTIVIWMVAWDADNVSQIQDVWVKIDGGAPRNATYNHTDHEGQWWFYEWDTTEVDDGWHDITAIVFDGQDDGHDVIEVLVDNEPENHAPSIEIVEPDHGATVSGTIVIWMVAWDADNLSEIQDVWVRIDGGHLRNATYNHTDHEGQWWFYEWDTTEVDDGWHDITAIVFDGQDDGHDVIEVLVDNEPENHAPSIEIVEPDHGATVSGTIVIWMVAWDADNLSEIQDVWVKIDGGHLRNATYNHTDHEGQWWYYEWDTTEVDDGWHDITAIVFDGQDDGHDVIEVYVDNVPPSPMQREIQDIEEGDSVSGNTEIKIQAWDPTGNEEIESVQIRIDDGEWQDATLVEPEDGEPYWVLEWDTTNVKNGEHHIYTRINGEPEGSEPEAIGVVVDNPDKDNEFWSAFPWALLTLIGILIGLSVFAITEVGKIALFSLIFLPLYTKISKKDILDHFVRGQIFGYIKINPGDNYTTIKNNLELPNGTLTYHLNILEKEGLVKSWSDGRHKFFYPQGVKIPGNGVKNPSIYDAIQKSIMESPGITVKDIAVVNGISRQLANYHVRKLAAEGKIELERKSLSKVCYPMDS